MSRRRKFAIAAVAVALAAIVILSTIAVLRSDWFRNKVRARIVAEVEQATGGRVQINAFQFDWKQMRAQVNGFVLRGTEPADGPPLFTADTIVIGLKIVSIVKRSVDLQYLEVRRPQIYLIVYPDGRTNFPSPKIRRTGKDPLQSVLDLAIGRYTLRDGTFEVRGQSKTPFDAQGEHLAATFTYDAAGPGYRGKIAISPARLQLPNLQPVALNVNLALAVRKNRINIESGTLATAQSQIDFAGAIESLADFSGSLTYKTRVTLAEPVRVLNLHTELDGAVTASGTLHFRGTSDYQVSGSLHAARVQFHPAPEFTLRDAGVDADYSIDPRRAVLTNLRIAGAATATAQPFPWNGRIEKVTLRPTLIDAGGIHIDALGGAFIGQAQLADLRQLHVEGEAAGFDAQQLMRAYNGQSIPWNAAASGPFQLNVALGKPTTLRVAANIALAPAGTGAPVHGSVDATYDAATETLDLGNSSLALPSTKVNFSGVLGSQLRVRADSRNLDEILPAFNIHSLPVKLQNGEAVFDGTITGKLEDPHIAGKGHATGVVWSGRVFDSLAGEIDLSRAGIAVHNGSVQQGALHAQGSGSLALSDWKVEDASALSATGAIRNAPIADLLALAPEENGKNFPVQGTLSAEGKISGTVGDPRIAATITATKGAIEREPFDQITGSLAYSGDTIEMANTQITAGSRRVTLQAGYRHQPKNLSTGRLQFHVDSNAMPVSAFETVRREYPNISGTAELHASGEVDIVPQQPGELPFHVVSLTGALSGRGLHINDQPVRDGTLTAQTTGNELTAHFDSELAGSVVEGDGKWTLTDDYPGSLRVSFKGLDLERLRNWLRQKAPGGMTFAGAVEGSLTITGPAVKPDLWKAQLRIPSIHIGPGGAYSASLGDLALHNPEPIVVSMERNVVKVESARLVGRTTDLSVTGTVNLQQKSLLDLRVGGRVDLATVRDFVPDIYGSGAIETSVAVRGSLTQPQVNGRMEIKNATFNLAELPIGISNTNGVILFDATRATIQSFSGESGGGTFTLSGFAGYDGDSLVFRLHANAHEMRVRYPEDFSTVSSASLSLTGTSDSSTLSGRITVLRTSFNPHSDFSSILAKSAEPVRTPSAQTGLVANMHFDVQIDSAPDITFQSSLAQGLEAEANLHLRGTGSNPSLLGRINITQGQIVFFGTPFTVNQGSIAFYDPVKIDPVLNLDLDTKARGIDVILNIAGPINKLNLTPRSDPPMPFSEIVALLATGREPTGDYATLMSSPASPQSLQQMGASALLGQAIASPVTGRLQRFFGVTRLKIDPSLTDITGGENNPQARLTIEQQVTPEITFTYITDVTSTNPLVIQVEWAFSKRWSAVALRDENGLVGLNFVYKRRF